MAVLKNIIFDLGGVLINIDYKKTEQAFTDLGVTNFREMYAQYAADELFESLETGHTSEERFYEFMTQKGNKLLEPVQVQKAWNAMLLDFRVESLQFLESLKEKYALYLLSNTNAIHKSAFDKIFTDQTGLPTMDTFFKKAYYSHMIGFRKPNENIYEYVLKDAGINARETLFIDDSVNNLEAAARLGIRTHLLLPEERIEGLDYDLI